MKHRAEGVEQGAMAVSRETKQRLDAFANLLRQWNKTINLISRNDEGEIWPRHISDSLQLIRYLPEAAGPIIDLGSGAGFPGLVLAIATQCPVDLIESDHRKSAFLREAVRLTGANATIHAARIETVTLQKVRVVTARALAPLDQLIGLAHNFLADDGFLLAPKGANVAAELAVARTRWLMAVQSIPSLTNTDASILKISEVRRVGTDI